MESIRTINGVLKYHNVKTNNRNKILTTNIIDIHFVNRFIFCFYEQFTDFWIVFGAFFEGL
ncbi:MAG TPA: hypothetical protein DEH24_12385 [Alteromonas sp.]|nr:hypothetical protein [Alteromonadaceae bacterium]MAX41272.1 hypothetical protein [Alteromonadaceae bacterium]HBY40212.1 hypothetical protein [Alteromonas sp.]